MYVKNLNEKVRLDSLKECLFSMFSRFGRVVQVSAKRNVVMRGQAFVVFQSPAHAEAARGALHQAPFFGKPMEVHWARRDSDITLSPGQAQAVRATRKRLITKNYFQSAQFKKRMARKLALRSKEMAGLGQLNMAILGKMLNSKEDRPGGGAPGGPAQRRLNEPHSMLLLEKLPDVDKAALEALFAGQEGLKEIRHIGPKRIALVDFEDSASAAAALERVREQRFEGGEPVRINFAKK